MASSPKRRKRGERVAELLSNPDTLLKICDFIICGGTLIEWARKNDVPYNAIAAWVVAEDHRRKKFDAAKEMRGEFLSELVVRNLRMFADLDIGKAYDKQGKLLPITEMPEDIRRAITMFEIQQEAVDGTDPGPMGGQLRRRRRPDDEEEGDRETPELVQTYTTKIKTISPERALELLGKYRRMFIEKVEHSGKVTLEDLVAGSHTPDPPTT